jgi:hypothetical protein
VDVAAFALKVHEFARQLPCSVTSWGRTPAHNFAVGGVPRSQHLAWLAVDVVYDKPFPDKATRLEVAQLVGLRIFIEPDHDHLEARPEQPPIPSPSAPPPSKDRRGSRAARGPKRS